MSEGSEPLLGNRPPRRLGPSVGLGLAAGLAVGMVATLAHMRAHEWDPHEIPLANYLVLWPAIGAVIGYIRGRGDAPTSVDSSEETHERQRRRRARFVATGFTIGLGLGFVATGVDFLWRGWLILETQPVFNLMLFPYFGVLLGFNLSRVPGEPKWSWRFTRFNMRTMMVMIAYLALLFGLGVQFGRIGAVARGYHQRYLNAKQMAALFDGLLRKDQGQAPMRFKNAEQLRVGAIPADILQIQKDFLKSLDTNKKVTPAYRKYRFDLIADGEERQGRLSETNAQMFTTLVDYHSKLAAKYKKAEQNPWLPVEPDPPPP